MDRTKFTWVVHNTNDEIHMISDLGAGGFALPPHRDVPLHEIFPWVMLEQSKDLVLAEMNGDIKVTKHITFPSQPKETVNISEIKKTEELNNIKQQLDDLKALLASQQQQQPQQPTVIEQQPIIQQQQLDVDKLTDLIVSKIPKQEVIVQKQFIDSKDQEQEELIGYSEPSPEDIATKHLTSGDKLSSSVKEGKTKTVKESKTSHSADDIADLLGNAGL